MGDNTQKAIAILIKANKEAFKLLGMKRIKFDCSINGEWQLDIFANPKKPRLMLPVGKPPQAKRPRSKKGG